MNNCSRYVNVCFFGILVKALLYSSFAFDFQEFGQSEIDAHKYIHKDGNHRVLKNLTSGLFEVLGREDNALRVRIKQDFVGYCEAGNPSAVASEFVATYRDAESGEEVCVLQRYADACYSRVLTVGCDPKTNLAQLTIIAVYEKFLPENLALNTEVIRPCFFTDELFIKRARSIKVTIPCNFENSTLCMNNEDCPLGTYCSGGSSYDRPVPLKFCMPFLKPGEACKYREAYLRFYDIDIDPERLDKCGSGSYCRIDPSQCKDPNRNPLTRPATCVPYGKECSLDIDCNTSTEYCYLGSCTPYVKDGECCAGGKNLYSSQNLRPVNCHGNSKCSRLYSAEDLYKDEYLPRPPQICRPPCTKHADCVAEVEVCGPPTSSKGLRHCTCAPSVCSRDKTARRRFVAMYPWGD